MTESLRQWFQFSKAEGEQLQTEGPGPSGQLELTDSMLRDWPSGDLFGLTQNAGMGWDPQHMSGPQFLVLSTLGGLRGDDEGRPPRLRTRFPAETE